MVAAAAAADRDDDDETLVMSCCVLVAMSAVNLQRQFTVSLYRGVVTMDNWLTVEDTEGLEIIISHYQMLEPGIGIYVCQTNH